MQKRLFHAVFVMVLLIVLIGIPMVTHFDVFGAQTSYDATSSASVKLPDQPSGDFVILINMSLHKDTVAEWESFFKDEEFAVIFEDIRCMVASGDTAGLQLAERFQAQLPENQMQIHTENPTLLVSKAEAGYIDVAVFSREMADVLQLKPQEELSGIAVVEVSGGN